jgi:hypothetical protein
MTHCEDRDDTPEPGARRRSRPGFAGPGARRAGFVGVQAEQGGPHRNAFRTRPGGHRNSRRFEATFDQAPPGPCSRDGCAAHSRIRPKCTSAKLSARAQC